MLQGDSLGLEEMRVEVLDLPQYTPSSRTENALRNRKLARFAGCFEAYHRTYIRDVATASPITYARTPRFVPPDATVEFASASNAMVHSPTCRSVPSHRCTTR